ncbi:hypothetical protein XarbCFBP8150_21910, partial [Xanthomonas arboricola]
MHAPKVCADEPAQLKLAALLPVPVSCSELPTALLLLSLTGTGSSAANFSWAGSSAQTFGACNRG